MSIIQEALKKAQGYVESKRSSQKEAASKAPRLTMPLLLIFFILLGFAAREFLLTKKIRDGAKPIDDIGALDTQSHQEVTYKQVLTTIAPGPSGQPMKLPQAIPQYPKFSLNGIMYLPEKPQAIVNGAIVEEGDTIGGAKVVKITEKSVVLNFNKAEITLSLKK